MTNIGELLAIIGKVVVWWITRNETNKAAAIEAINRKAEGWANASAGNIFDSTR